MAMPQISMGQPVNRFTAQGKVKIYPNQGGHYNSNTRAWCPVHGCEEEKDECLYLTMLHLIEGNPQIILIDLGNSRAQPAAVPGWEPFWMKGTQGGKHGNVAYGRGGIPAQEIADFLSANPSTDVHKIEVKDDLLIIWASSLGPWIGQGGRWAQAIKRLDITVSFRELVEITEIQLAKMPEDMQKIAKDGAIVATQARRNANMCDRNIMLVLGMDPKSPAWNAVKHF